MTSDAAAPDPAADVDVTLRLAGDEDADAIAALLVRVRAAAVAAGTMPPPVHPAADMIRHVREDVLARREVWVAEVSASAPGDPDSAPVDAELVAVMALGDQWLDDLYVLPDHAGRGIGSTLLELAKSLRPGGFELWVFEINAPARRFYERHGLVALERTDGSGNEERAPDLRYGWRRDAGT